MKAVCVRNTNKETPERNGRNVFLTIGKVYEVKNNLYSGHDGYETTYTLTSDTGLDIAVPKYYFKLIDEYRQEQLDKILE